MKADKCPFCLSEEVTNGWCTSKTGGGVPIAYCGSCGHSHTRSKRRTVRSMCIKAKEGEEWKETAEAFLKDARALMDLRMQVKQIEDLRDHWKHQAESSAEQVREFSYKAKLWDRLVSLNDLLDCVLDGINQFRLKQLTDQVVHSVEEDDS